MANINKVYEFNLPGNAQPSWAFSFPFFPFLSPTLDLSSFLSELGVSHIPGWPQTYYVILNFCSFGIIRICHHFLCSRTQGSVYARQALYQLSYGNICPTLSLCLVS